MMAFSSRRSLGGKPISAVLPARILETEYSVREGELRTLTSRHVFDVELMIML